MGTTEKRCGVDMRRKDSFVKLMDIEVYDPDEEFDGEDVEDIIEMVREWI